MLDNFYTSRKQVNLQEYTPDFKDLSFWVPWWDSFLVKATRLSSWYFRIYPDGTTMTFINPSTPGGISLPVYGMTAGNYLYAAYRQGVGYPYYPYYPDEFTLLSDYQYGKRVAEWQIYENPAMPEQASLPYFDLNRRFVLYAKRTSHMTADLVKLSLDSGEVLKLYDVNMSLPTNSFINSSIKIRHVNPTMVMLLTDSPEHTGAASKNKIVVVDYVSDRIVLTGYVGPYWHAEFYSKYGLIVVITPDRYVKVYSLNALPTTLSNPVLERSTIRVGEMSKVRVSLTGSDGEPCKDYVIHWECPGNRGRLFKSRTKTGEDGVAENWYMAPDSPGPARINTWVVV